MNYNFPDEGWFIALGSEPVPESATMLLLGTGLTGLAEFRRKRKKQEVLVLFTGMYYKFGRLHENG